MTSSLLIAQGKSSPKVRLLFSSLSSPFFSQGDLETEQAEKAALVAFRALMLREAPKGRVSRHQCFLTPGHDQDPRKAVESVLFPVMKPADMLYTFVKQVWKELAGGKKKGICVRACYTLNACFQLCPLATDTTA